MERAVGFDELRWLQELAYKQPRGRMPDDVGASLITRGLIERQGDGFMLTMRGRIALAKLG